MTCHREEDATVTYLTVAAMPQSLLYVVQPVTRPGL
jgi:hypothetical protein